MIPILHDEHRGIAHDVEIFEIVEVALVAAHIEPRVVVLLYIFLPAVNVRGVGDGIDIEIALADGLQRVIDLA